MAHDGKTLKRLSKDKRETRRELRLDAPFAPPGTPGSAGFAEFLAFHELTCEVRALRHKKRWKELRAKERKLAERSKVMPKFGEALRAFLADEIDAATVARRIRRICPNKKLQREILDFFAAPSPPPTMTAEEMAREQQDIARAERILHAWKKTTLAVDLLGEHADAGEAEAIKNLADVAEHAIQRLMIAEKRHPETARKVARGRMLWPLLAGIEPGWEEEGLKRIERLELGKDLEFLRAPFRAARGTDENYPARQWAKTAVRALEETRRRVQVFGHYGEEFKELIFEQGVALAASPNWTDGACHLPPLCKDTARQWGLVIRQMIREQQPDFHSRPEWATQRNTARHSGRGTRGEIQHAILDDIVSALRRIAPPTKLPKSAS